MGYVMYGVKQSDSIKLLSKAQIIQYCVHIVISFRERQAVNEAVPRAKSSQKARTDQSLLKVALQNSFFYYSSTLL